MTLKDDQGLCECPELLSVGQAGFCLGKLCTGPEQCQYQKGWFHGISSHGHWTARGTVLLFVAASSTHATPRLVCPLAHQILHSSNGASSTHQHGGHGRTCALLCIGGTLQRHKGNDSLSVSMLCMLMMTVFCMAPVNRICPGTDAFWCHIYATYSI